MSRSAVFAAMAVGAVLLSSVAAAQLPTTVQRMTPSDAVRTVGLLHFMGLGVFSDGVFVDPASIQRQAGKAEAQVLTVRGELWHVAEGVIRWSWDTVKADCAGGRLTRTTSDHYAEDGAWVAALDDPQGAGDEPDIPVEEALLAYLCDGTQPKDFQIVPTKNIAVEGIVNAFAKQ